MPFPIDDTLSLAVILAWLRANAGKIALGGAICALLAVPIVVFRPKTFESSATLMVFPPMFKQDNVQTDNIAEMMPQALPVEAYKALALSPSVLDEVIRTVPLENTGFLGLRSRLEVELIERGSRGSQGISYTQALMFHASAQDPELAAKTAQTWAEVFKKHVDEVAAKGVGESFVLLDTLHNSMRAKLEEADRLLAEHQKAWNLDLIRAQLDAKQQEYTGFQGSLKHAEVDLAAAEMKLKALEEELAKEPEKKVYFRAPSDDAYWIAGLQGRGDAAGPERGLRTEEPNENYVSTRRSIIRAKEAVEGLKAESAAVVMKFEELDEEIQGLTTTFSDQTIERQKLAREADNLQSSYAVVRTEFEKGRMADQTQASDIVIAGQAVPPDQPSSPGSAKLVVVVGIFGLFLTGGLLAMKEISEMAPLNGLGFERSGVFNTLGSEAEPNGEPAKSGVTDAKREELARTIKP